MPKQSSSRVPGHSDKNWADKQSQYGHSPLAGAGFEGEEDIDLRHTVEKGIHEPSGKSIAPNAVADAAKPLRNHSVGGPDTVIERAAEASHQRDYDSAGPAGQQKPTNLNRKKRGSGSPSDGDIVERGAN